MSRIDVEYYGSLPPDHPQYGLTRESFDDSVLPVLSSGQAELIHGGHVVEREIGNGVWFEGCPGHTPGNMVIHAQSGGSSGSRHAIFTGDVFHHPLQIQDPTLHINADADLEQGLATRRRLIDAYADTGAILLAAHFPEPTAGCVVSDGAGETFRFLDPAE